MGAMKDLTVYVVSACWWRDGATVLGVADSPEGAMEVADRFDGPGESPNFGSWGGWRTEADQDPPQRWTRDAMTKTGAVHPSLYQEIVAVPLRLSVKLGEAVRQSDGSVHAPAAIRMDFRSADTTGGDSSALRAMLTESLRRGRRPR